jgi:hypothetical protein
LFSLLLLLRNILSKDSQPRRRGAGLGASTVYYI